mgnify:CR=1 FL=1
MAMNLGVGGPPKKKGVAPPPFGGNRGGSPVKAASPFAPGGGGDKGGAAVMEEAPSGKGLTLPDGRGSDSGVGDRAADDRGMATSGGIAPEAVCYRSEMETCGACVYNESGECSRLSIPVSDGDGCNLFTDRGGQGMESESPAEEMEPAVAV